MKTLAQIPTMLTLIFATLMVLLRDDYLTAEPKAYVHDESNVD